MDIDRAAPQHQLDDPDLTLALLMQIWPTTIAVFMRHRMQCVGCLVRRFTTIADACRVYHIAQSDFRDELGRAITYVKAASLSRTS